jgi:hypothetical protein
VRLIGRDENCQRVPRKNCDAITFRSLPTPENPSTHNPQRTQNPERNESGSDERALAPDVEHIAAHCGPIFFYRRDGVYVFVRVLTSIAADSESPDKQMPSSAYPWSRTDGNRFRRVDISFAERAETTMKRPQLQPPGRLFAPSFTKRIHR